MNDTIRRSARATRDGVNDGSLDRAEHLSGIVESIVTANRRLNAFLHFDPYEACRVDASESGGPLAGVPVAVKDNIVTRGTLTTCASRILENFRSPVDATVVSRLRNAGAAIVGKTNLDEFAMGSSTEHSAFGPTSNPWDLDRVPGGSSGGSAAAVAAGLVPVALGSDTGGSVRQPAAFCGVLGLKPTWGRVSRSGLIAFASSLDQIGVFAREVGDLAEVLSIIAGVDPLDATSSAVPVPDYSREAEAGIDGLRCAVVEGLVEGLDDDVRQNFESTIAILERGGARIEKVRLSTIDFAIATYYIVANAEASANLARFDGVRYGRRSDQNGSLRDLYVQSRSDGFGAEVKRRIMLGTFALSSGYYDAYYGRAQKVRALMRQEFVDAFSRVDVLLTPTTPTPAFRKGEKTEDPLSMYLSDVFTAPANLVGIPSLSVPSGLSQGGLPLALQVTGPAFSEGRLMAAARVIERELGPFVCAA